jgi:Pyruvate/2-oxoacid:ferredoxin oxidoreductase delta subunit
MARAGAISRRAFLTGAPARTSAPAREPGQLAVGRTMACSARIGETCLALAGIACMVCRDVCPEQAISLNLHRGGVFLPQLDAETCTGCGACVAPCPGAAIVMQPLETDHA